MWERRPDHCNALHKKKYRVSTCKDLKENLEIANDLKVNVMKAVKVNIDVNVNTSHDERYLEVFEFKVEFGPVKKSRKWLFWILSGAIAALAAGLLIALL